MHNQIFPRTSVHGSFGLLVLILIVCCFLSGDILHAKSHAGSSGASFVQGSALIDSLRTRLQQDSMNLGLRWQYANKLYESNFSQEALQECRRILAQDSTFVPVYLTIGAMLTSQATTASDSTKARQALRHLAKITNTTMDLPGGSKAYMTLFFQAQNYCTLHEYNTAIQLLNQYIALDSTNGYVYYQRYSAQAAQSCVRSTYDLDRAILYTKTKLQPYFYVDRAGVRLTMGEVDSARADAERAISLGIESGHSYTFLAGALHDQKQYKLAFEAITKAFTFPTVPALAYCFRGLLRMERQEYGSAIEDFDEFLKRGKSISEDVIKYINQVKEWYSRN
jgi:tetratricopeptide (TPR) repeat protein